MDFITKKYAIIGASQSGKSYWIAQNLIKPGHYEWIALCGAERNLSFYEDAIPKNKKITMEYYGHDPDEVLMNLESLVEKMDEIISKQPKKVKTVLVLFDDFVNPSVLRNQKFINFVVTSRHSNIAIAFASQFVNTIISPLLKTQMTHFVICQHDPGRAFDEFLKDFLDPKLVQEFMAKNDRLPERDEIKKERSRVLLEAFNGRFGKILIDQEEIRFAVIKPIESLEGNKIRVQSKEIMK